MIRKLTAIFLVLAVSILSAGCGNDIDKISVEHVKEDLEEFRQYHHSVHLAFQGEQEIIDAFEGKYEEIMQSITAPISDAELFFMLSEIAATLNDGHGSVIYTGWQDGQFLPLRLVWLAEGLIVVESQVDGISKGDKITSINAKSPEDLLLDFDQILSSENIDWVRYRAARLMPQAHFLKGLDLVNDNGTVTLNIEAVSGGALEFMVDLSSEYLRPPQMPLVETMFFDEQGAALFRLNRCEDSDEYAEALEEFFQQVREKETGKVIVDLRYNPGGDSRVIARFMSYLDVHSYVNYYNHTGRQSIYANRRERNPFGGEIYVATSNATFSSANLFTGIIKYNDLGLTIGEPTGNANAAYGGTNLAQLTNSGIYYFVSAQKWFLPDSETDYHPSIQPDIYIPLTRNDIIYDRDPIIDWIYGR